MAKPYVTVSLMLHGTDSELEITDYVDNNGRFVPIGTQAAKAIEDRSQIHFVDAEGVEVIIPFHAIVEISITKESDAYTPLDNDYCIVDPCVAAKNCNTSWTIKFYDGETFLYETIVKDDEVPVYDGSTPTKECYTFLGWNTDKTAETALEALPAATGTATYYAIFEKNEYTITWMNGDTKLDDDEVECGETPAYTGETPTGTGTFTGWSATPDGEALETIPPATADATYYAVFIV